MAREIYFRERWTEADVLALEDAEHSDVERKAGRLFDEKQLDRFNNELAITVSAFANSGGGWIIIGQSDDAAKFDGLPTVKGRQPIREWIERLIPQLVQSPLAAFKVHKVERADSNSNIPTDRCIIVIEIGDSPLAPHQAVSDKKYYRRSGSNSIPAEHFYIETLRSRYVGAILELEFTELRLIPDLQLVMQGTPMLHLGLFAKLTNVGRVVSNRWAVKCDFDGYQHPFWLYKDGLFGPSEEFILPALSQEFKIEFGVQRGESLYYALHNVVPLLKDMTVRHFVVADTQRGEIIEQSVKPLVSRKFEEDLTVFMRQFDK